MYCSTGHDDLDDLLDYTRSELGNTIMVILMDEDIEAVEIQQEFDELFFAMFNCQPPQSLQDLLDDLWEKLRELERWGVELYFDGSREQAAALRLPHWRGVYYESSRN